MNIQESELTQQIAELRTEIKKLYFICDRVFHHLGASVDFERAKAGWAERQQVELEKNAVKAAKEGD
jgi:hypothetical protein